MLFHIRRVLPRVHLACGLAWVLLAAAPGGAAPAQFEDADVKAAFILNFVKFVTWPDDTQAEGPLTVVVMSAPALVRALDEAVARQPPGGRQVVVRAMTSAEGPVPAPHLLFIGETERHNLQGLLRRFEGRPVLTVGDGQGFGSSGVILNFYVSDTRIRFEANTTAAARARLQLSSHLLRLARIVG